MSLRRKMIALISAMLLLMVLLSIVFIYNESSKILKDEAEQYMEAQLDRANENVRLLFSRIVLETEKLSLDHYVQGFFTGTYTVEETNAYLTKMMLQKNVQELLYMDLFLVNYKGEIVSAAMKEAVGVDVSTRKYFETAVKKGVTDTSDIILSRADETQIVITLTPTINEKGDVLGYTGIAIFATYFSRFLEDFNVSDSNGYIIVDSYDNIVSHPNKTLISSEFDYFGQDKNLINEINTISIEGETYRILQKNLGFNDWKIISFLKYDEIYSKSLDLSYSFMKMSVVIVFIALLFSMYLTDMVSRPIVKITESINRMIEDEEGFQSTMINQLTFNELDHEDITEKKDMEPSEVSNLRKAIVGFKTALEKGAQNFDVEYTKLQTYLDGLYKELENVNARNLDFIATLSHDIRTPLTLIKGYARGLESGEVTDKAMQAKFQSGIVNSVDDIEKLVYNVLDFAYEINSSTALELKEYSMNEVIEALNFELKQLYAEYNKHIQFEMDDFKESALTVTIDLTHFKRVIVNLLNNSFKYTSKDDLIRFRILNKVQRVVFEVYDEGIGIKENDLENIFDMFYRTDDSKNIKGYGLGLYISHQILKGHGIDLKCESEYGSFTRMYFSVEQTELKT